MPIRQGEPRRTEGPGPGRRRWRLVALIAALAVAAALAAASSLDVAGFLSSRWRDIEAFAQARPVLAGFAFVALYVAATLLMVPGVLWLTMGAGAAFGAAVAAGLTWLAAMIGATAVFLLARTALGARLARHSAGWAQMLRAGFQRNAFTYLLSLRLLPFAPFFAVNLAPALLGVRLRTFVAATAIGMIPGVAVYATIGAGLAEAFRSGGSVGLAGALRPEIVAALVAAALLALAPLIWRAVRGAPWRQRLSALRKWASAARMTMMSQFTRARPAAASTRVASSLSGRLLALTAAFVLVAELLVFAPALATFQRTWLSERVTAAQIAALAVSATQEPAAAQKLTSDLLDGDLLIVTLSGAEAAMQLGPEGATAPPAPSRTIDLRTQTLGGALRSAFTTLFAEDGGTVRVIAAPRLGLGDRLELVVNERALAEAMRSFARQALFESLFIGLITGALVYATLIIAFVRPMEAITRQILRFRERPQDASIALRPSGRDDEIGRAEVALAEMQDQVRQSLRQQERLAGLGAAVAKIAHDMRASLATAQLVSERLADSDDPKVRQVAPRLVRSIERAEALASAALRYGRAEEGTPTLVPLVVQDALEEAAVEALAPYPAILWRNGARADARVTADAEQLHRVLANLIRNAAQALARQSGRQDPGTIAATATRVGERVLIRIVDDGPGLPESAKARLFEPFSASANPDGAGLGLAIARELAQAQGGALRLISSSEQGVAFEIELGAA